ncbi:MAG: hypothetical protein GY839_06605 [candidate division Zixibacteria bacterium]|nr:hypothetical protein [candidate division Zixibacteria bacterium]
MKLIVFEDTNADNFYPLSVSHPVFDLWYGCSRVLKRLKYYFKQNGVILSCRPHLAAVTRERYKLPVNEFDNFRDECLLVNAAMIPKPEILNKLATANSDTAFIDEDILIGARLSSEFLEKCNLIDLIDKPSVFYSKFKAVESEGSVFRYLWEIIDKNEEMIENDVELLPEIKSWERSDEYSKPDHPIFIHPSIETLSGVYIESKKGPVIIDENAVIEPRSLIQGPAYIGKDSVIMAGLIREGCSLGPVCKVGGELEESIILGYSNKSHEGFIGHAYLGEWVNLGALTTNSDLKNNYGEISVQLMGKVIKTGLNKVGCFIGDHTKTGIGTTFNTGIVIGFSNNLYGGSLFLEKEIGHLKWGTPGALVDFKLDKAIGLARKAMPRRHRELSQASEELFRHIKS